MCCAEATLRQAAGCICRQRMKTGVSWRFRDTPVMCGVVSGQRQQEQASDRGDNRILKVFCVPQARTTPVF